MLSASGSTGSAPAPAAAAGGPGNTNNNNSRRRWSGRANSAASSSSAKPLLKIAALKDPVFDFGPNIKPDQFQRTRLAIENYIQTTIKDPADIVDAIRHLKAPATLTPPTRPVRDINKPDEWNFDFEQWKLDNAEYNTRSTRFKSQSATAWGIIYGQCSAALRTELEGTNGFQKCREDHDVIALLTMIEALCSKLGDKNQEYFAVATSFKTLCMYYQPDGMTNDEYYDRFKAMVRVIRKFAGDLAIGYLPALAKQELEVMATRDGYSLSSAADAQKKEARDTASDKFLACLMLSGASHKKYNPLRAELSNSFAMGDDRYPTTIEGTLRLLNSYVPLTSIPPARASSNSAASSNRDPIDEQAMFAQNDD